MIAVAPTAAPAPAAARPRLLYVDWLRGLAVLFMFEAHVYSSWLTPAAKHTRVFAWASVVAGYAAPLFLFLSGVGMTLALQAALGRGGSYADARRAAIRRGFEILLAGFAFRVQEHILGGGPVANLFRVDILNTIGVSMMLGAWLVFPPARGRWAWRALLAALLGALLSPLVGGIPWPWSTWPLTAYLSDGRQWFFPLFPFAAYTFAGLFAGTLWGRSDGDPARMRRVMLATFAAGAALIAGSWLYLGLPATKFLAFGGKWRSLPTYTLTHLGWICVFAAAAHAVQGFFHPSRFGPLRQLGRTSLLMYWVHVELVYGHLAGSGALDLKERLDFAEASVGLAALTLAMLALSWFRTHYLGHFRAAVIFERLWRELATYTRDSWRKSAARARR